jgi:ribosomal protein S3
MSNVFCFFEAICVHNSNKFLSSKHTHEIIKGWEILFSYFKSVLRQKSIAKDKGSHPRHLMMMVIIKRRRTECVMGDEIKILLQLRKYLLNEEKEKRRLSIHVSIYFFLEEKWYEEKNHPLDTQANIRFKLKRK